MTAETVVVIVSLDNGLSPLRMKPSYQPLMTYGYLSLDHCE